MFDILTISVFFNIAFYVFFGILCAMYFKNKGKTTGLHRPIFIILLWLPFVVLGSLVMLYEWLFSSKVTDTDYFQKCPTCGETFDVREYYLYCNGDGDNVHSRVGTDYIRAWDMASDKESESVSVCGYYDKDGKFIVKNMEYIKEKNGE